jgi:aspartyl-tRNA(Asn)/glutamyl-tRNA(Gln) amidotransferase subunit C
MKKITKEEIIRVAELARIDMPETEAVATADEVSSILSFVDILQSVDTEGVKPTSQVTALSDVWREDLVVSCDVPQTELLANAPMLEAGYIKVKKVL